jgi:L-histidine N-alpha-methyltransferase
MFMQPSAASAERQTEARQAFADAVQFYLTQIPRQLPSEFFYDPLGSALFEAICELPWYRITRAERALLGRHGADILSRADPVATIVELGPGSGDKLATLLSARKIARRTTVHLVDVSAAALTLASRTLGELDAIDVVAHQAPYEAGLVDATAAVGRSGRTMIVFLGSNIGNFDPPGADAFLAGVRASLSPHDTLLVGADLVKPERDLLLAYDDPLGITAAFNRNLLVRINRELGADFDLDGFAHRAVWNAEESRVEMHLVSTRRQHVHVPGAAIDAMFDAGETIWTESSYKYEPEAIASVLERAGFERVEQWLDTDARFALTLVEAV